MGLSFVLKSKVIHQKGAEKKWGKGKRGEKETCITGSMQDLIGSVAKKCGCVSAELCFSVVTAGWLEISVRRAFNLMGDKTRNKATPGIMSMFLTQNHVVSCSMKT